MPEKKRYAIVGAGHRGADGFARPILTRFGDIADLVALMDINPARMAGVCSYLGKDLPCYTDFDQMIRQARPDAVIVTTRDGAHAEYVVRALLAGKRVYCEKPLCTTPQQCREVLAAVKKTGGVCLTTHNLRYDAGCQAVRAAIRQGRIGRLLHVNFLHTLDRRHGADYFRRWHRHTRFSGGLQIHKCSHHFDQLNWWIGSLPRTAFAQGDLVFYGRNNPFRGTRCRGCEHAGHCVMHREFTGEVFQKLYFAAEHVDGYYRDGCVWDESIDAPDQFDVVLRYDNGVTANYALQAHAATEGELVELDGTLGRMIYYIRYSPTRMESLKIMLPGCADEVSIDIQRSEGEHGGADPRLLADFMTSPWDLPSNPMMATIEEGVQAVLIGAAVSRSMASGQSIDVQSLLED